jgi:acyl dehydratase
VSPDRLELRRTLTQGDFDRFAALSGDDNPIHVDPAYAGRTRFGRTVSHGILLVTVLRGLAEKLAPRLEVARHEVRFPAPTYADEPMVFAVWPEDGGGLGFSTTREADGAVTCDGRFGPPPTSEAAPPSPNPLPREGGEGSGASAELTRSFDMTDVETYVSLGGEQAVADEVPATLISALFSYLLGVRLPGPGANYLKQETDFIGGARIGEELTARVEVTRLRPEKSLVDLETTCHGADGRPIATGRALIFVGDVA